MCEAESYQLTGTNQQARNPKVNRAEVNINNVCRGPQVNVGV